MPDGDVGYRKRKLVICAPRKRYGDWEPRTDAQQRWNRAATRAATLENLDVWLLNERDLGATSFSAYPVSI